MLLLTGNPFPDMFARAGTRAFHCEVRDSYLVDDEAESLARFMAGRRPADPPESWLAWRALVWQSTMRGVAVQRVRTVTVPHSDYVRWLIKTTADGDLGQNEDIRWLPRHLADDITLPRDDWWLFDDHVVAFNVVDHAGAPAGLAVTDDPLVANLYTALRNKLWDRAIPHARYVESEHVLT
jgi:hypothetical protein